MDFCCGATMTARLAPMYSEGGVLLTDVPFLYCQTCGNMVLAPSFELEVTMFAHQCEADSMKRASFFDVIDQDAVKELQATYPKRTEQHTPYVTDDQIDHMLDAWNVALQLGDDVWIKDIKAALLFLHKVRSEQQLPIRQTS